MTILNLTRDVSGRNTYSRQVPDYKRASTLASGAEQTFTLPTTNEKGYLVIFSYEAGSKVWVGVGSSSVTLPTGSFTDTNGELNPTTYTVEAGAILRFITNDTSAEIGVVAYDVQ